MEDLHCITDFIIFHKGKNGLDYLKFPSLFCLMNLVDKFNKLIITCFAYEPMCCAELSCSVVSNSLQPHRL